MLVVCTRLHVILPSRSNFTEESFAEVRFETGGWTGVSVYVRDHMGAVSSA